MATKKKKTAAKKAKTVKATAAKKATKTRASPRPRATKAEPQPEPQPPTTQDPPVDDALHRVVALLEADEASYRRSAAVVLGALAIPDDATLEALRKASRRADDASLRARAAEAIGALAPRSIVQDLMPLLKDSDASVRQTTRNVLASGKGVTEADIATMLSAKDERQRAGAIAVLGAMGTDEAQATILDQLEDASPKIWEAVQDALRPLYESLDDDAAGVAAENLCATLDSLDLSEAGRSKVLVELWAGLGHEAAAEGLCTVAGTPTEDAVRIRALEVLRSVLRARRQGINVFASLLGMLEADDTPSALLGPACDALAGIDVPMNLERRVRTLLQSEVTPVRRWAIRALGGLDSAPAARAVAEVADTGDATDRQVALEVGIGTTAGRNALARQLTKMTDEAKAMALASALKPHLSSLPKSTVEALGEAAVEAPEEVGKVIISLLNQGGVDSAQGPRQSV